MQKLSKLRVVLFFLLLIVLIVFIAVCFYLNNTVEVYAAEYTPTSSEEVSTETVSIEEVTLIANYSGQVRPNDEINFQVMLTPNYAIETAKNIEYLVVRGADYVIQKNNVLTINEDAKIGGFLEVRARVDGIESDSLTFMIVETPVAAVSILNEENSIRQNGTLQLNTEIFPTDATNRNLHYSIIVGEEYAKVNLNGLITVNNHLPRGNLTITVRAESIANTQAYAEKTFELYVPTRSLSILVSNTNPALGESIIMNALADPTASDSDSQFSVRKQDLKYIKSSHGNVLTIAEEIDDFNPTVTIFYTRDGITATKTIEIYIPTMSLVFDSPATEIKQGGMVQFSIIPTPKNATLNNLEFSLSDTDNASITKEGLLSAYILPERAYTSIEVIARIDDVAVSTIVGIVRPNVFLTANRLNPTTSSVSAQTVTLFTEVDGVVQTDNLVYNIKSGDNYIEGDIVSNGTFTIAKDITDYDPEIIISVTYCDWESNEIIISPVILVESIDFKNNVEFVEQQRNYDFKGICYPLNATKADMQLFYSLDVPSDIATINDDGVLSVSDLAPIGTRISVTINGPDGSRAEYSVTVRTVYATKLRLDKVTNQDGVEIFNNGTVHPRDVLTFDVSFPEPFNVTETQKIYVVEYNSGDNIAAYDGQTVTIKQQAYIGKYNPNVTFKIVSEQNGEVLVDYFTVYVHISVTHIEFKQLLTQVNEGTVLKLSDLVSAVAKPDNSNIRNIIYAISGNAELVGDYVYVDDNLTQGNLTFTLYLSAEDVSIEPLIFNIYVEAKNINFSVDNVTPLTQKSGGDTVTLAIKKDLAATDDLHLRIANGADLIVGNYSNDEIIPLIFDKNGYATFEFTVKKSTKIGAEKLIQFSVTQGSENRSADILVYKPIEDFNVTTSNTDGALRLITRGVSNSLYISFTADASEANKWTVDIEQINISNRSAPKIIVPQTATAGTEYVAIFRTNDRLNKSFEFTFVVDKLDEGLFKYVNNGNNASCNPYVKDSQNVVIDSDLPQLWVGRYTDVCFTYNGFSFSDYGIQISANGGVGFVNGSQYADLARISTDTVRLTVNSDASGKVSVQPKVIVQDGTQTYTINLKPIAAFRPMSGNPVLTNGAVVSNPQQLILGNGSFDTAATYGLDAFVFYGSSLNGAAITNSGSISVTSDSAGATQTIILKTQKPDGTYTQFYNNEGVFYSARITQGIIHRITLERQGGSGGPDTICAVNGRFDSISLPSRTGYIFGGYYTSAGGKGTQYYDANGKLKVTHSSYPTTSTLYAKWTPITYYVEFYYHNGQKIVPVHFNNGSTGDQRVTCKYDVTYYIKDYDVNGGTFNHWEINGVTYSNGQQAINTEEPWYKNLTATNGEVVRFVGYCNWKSCVATGSVITLADGTFKAVERLDGTERLLVWNFLSGTYDSAPILFIDNHGARTYEVVRLGFSDGTQIEVIDRHGFFNIDLQKYVFISKNNIEYLGDWFVTQEGKAQLVSIDCYEKQTVSYSPVTFGYMCYYINGLLSMPANTEPFINIFDIDIETMTVDKKSYEADINQYGLYTYYAFITDFNQYLNSDGQSMSLEETCAILPEMMFEAFGGQYMRISLEKENTTWQELVALIEQYSWQLTGGDE